jgi:hypothetical protein
MADEAGAARLAYELDQRAKGNATVEELSRWIDDYYGRTDKSAPLVWLDDG